MALVKVLVTGYVDDGKKKYTEGVHSFNEEDAALIVKSGAGTLHIPAENEEPKVEEAEVQFPTKKNSVKEIQAWLSDQGIEFGSDDKKEDLLAKVEEAKAQVED